MRTRVSGRARLGDILVQAKPIPAHVRILWLCVVLLLAHDHDSHGKTLLSIFVGPVVLPESLFFVCFLVICNTPFIIVVQCVSQDGNGKVGNTQSRNITTNNMNK